MTLDASLLNVLPKLAFWFRPRLDARATMSLAVVDIGVDYLDEKRASSFTRVDYEWKADGKVQRKSRIS